VAVVPDGVGDTGEAEGVDVGVGLGSASAGDGANDSDGQGETQPTDDKWFPSHPESTLADAGP
jgi:hypothetical protein